MRNTIYKFIIKNDGASVLEYALLISLIAAVVVVGLEIFGGGVLNLFADSTESVVEVIDSVAGGQ